MKTDGWAFVEQGPYSDTISRYLRNRYGFIKDTVKKCLIKKHYPCYYILNDQQKTGMGKERYDEKRKKTGNYL